MTSAVHEIPEEIILRFEDYDLYAVANTPQAKVDFLMSVLSKVDACVNSGPILLGYNRIIDCLTEAGVKRVVADTDSFENDYWYDLDTELINYVVDELLVDDLKLRAFVFDPRSQFVTDDRDNEVHRNFVKEDPEFEVHQYHNG